MARALGTTTETAAAVGIHPETLRRLYRAGIVPGYRTRRLLRFDLDEMLAALRSPASTPAGRATVEPDFDALDAAP